MRLAERVQHFDSSGIRKVFDLAARLNDPINLSIGQPDFDMPPAAQRAAIEAIQSGRNGYSPTQGLSPLVEKLQARLDAEFGHPDRGVFVTSGTSGGLVLAMLALVDPGDEVILFDPCFVMYPSLVRLAGGTPVFVDTYPDFAIDVDKLREAITPCTRLIMFNSPANPTGAVSSGAVTRAVAELAAQCGIALVSDEIYRLFCYDQPFESPAKWNAETLVIDGFSKSYGMTGWRVGWAHGPRELIQAMARLQQYTFVCAPQPGQWAGIEALDLDMQPHVADYRRKRDLVVAGLSGDYALSAPGGAFYAFPQVPWGDSDSFVAAAIEEKLLVIPGHIFSRRKTHFRLSYAAADSVIERGIEALRRLARRRA